jgi:plasmid maintenance system antidote protein VapI
MRRVAEIYHEGRGITANTALRLARYINTSAAFWVNLQSHYELEVAEDREAAKSRATCKRWSPRQLAERSCQPGHTGRFRVVCCPREVGTTNHGQPLRS